MPVESRTTSFQELTLHAGGKSDHELSGANASYMLIWVRGYIYILRGMGSVPGPASCDPRRGCCPMRGKEAMHAQVDPKRG